MKKPKMITKEQAFEIARLLKPRDRNIWKLCCETGLRISDVLKLRARELNNPMFVTEQKTGKVKTVELSDELFAALEPRKYDRYGLNSQIKILCNHQKWLFPSKIDARKHLHRSTYHRALKSACSTLKINFSAHSTRKLYAMEKFLETGDIFEVQKLLNHKYINVTADYLDIDLRGTINNALLNGRGGENANSHTASRGDQADNRTDQTGGGSANDKRTRENGESQ